MATGNVINIGTRVDLGSLQSDMQRAATAVSQASENMAKAQLNVRQASMAASEAFKEFTAGATKGSQEASDALLRSQQALNDARSAVSAWRGELKAADAALVELIVGEKEEEQTLRSGTSARMAASTELRVFEGNMMGSTRAAGAFLSQLPIIGTAMQAAFPVFGAIAVVTILGQAAEAAHKLYDEFVNLRSIVNIVDKEIAEEWSKQVELSNQHLENTRKLQVAQAELSGPKTGREQRGREAADRYDEALATNRLADAQRNLAIQQQHLQALREKAAGPKVNDSGGPLGGGIIGSGQSDDQKIAEEYARKQVEVVNTAAQELKNAQQALTIAQTSAKLHGLEENERLDAAGIAAAKIAADAQFQIMLQNGQRQLAFQEKLTESLTETWLKQDHVEQEMARKQEEYDKQKTRQFVENRRLEAEAAREAVRGQEVDSQNAAAISEALIRAQVATGAITALGAAKALAAVKTQEYTDKLKALQAELDAINSDVSTPSAQKAVQGQGIQNQISALQGQQAAQSITAQSQINQQIAQPYINAFNSINNSWLQLQSKLIFGTRNVGQAFANMGVSMLDGFATSVERMLVKSLEADLRMLLSHQVTNQLKVASDAVAAGESTAIKETEGLKQALIDAKGAAVAGWKAGMALPFPADLVAAPALAAAGFAGAIAQFDIGGIIPGSGAVPIIGHGGERVLTMEQTRSFERMVDNSMNHSGNASMNVHFHGSSDRLFREQMTRNANHVVKTVNRGLRNKGR